VPKGSQTLIQQGRKVASGDLIQSQRWQHLVSATDYQNSRIPVTVGLLVCNADIPPEYQSYTGNSRCLKAHCLVSRLCTLEVDLAPLKPFQSSLGKNGLYYQTNFEIVVNFGPEILYGLVVGNRVLGSVSAHYHNS
jgi:hypothetical protein